MTNIPLRTLFWMYIALAIVGCMLAAGLWPIEILGQALAIGSALAFVGALLTGVKLMKSKYDLNTLRDFHEREELKNIELEEPGEYDSVHCMNCGEVFNIRMPLCPRCGWSPGDPICRI